MGPGRVVASGRIAGRREVATAFAVQGGIFISLTTRLPALQDKWELGEVTLSALLLMMVLLAGAGSVLAERLAPRHGSAPVLRGGLLVMGLALPLLAAAPERVFFVAGLAFYGVALGLVDASTNMQGVTVERRARRPLMPSFHGAWTAGGVAAAALALLTGELRVEWIALLAVVPLAVAARHRFVPRAGATVSLTTTDVTPVAWRPLLLVGTAMVVFYLVDTASTTWGPLHLDETFAAPSRYVALATFPYLLASGAVRWAGDGLVARHGPVRVLRTGAVVALVGLVLVVGAPNWPLAVLGFTLTGGGVAVVAPLSFSAAASVAGSATDRDAQARVDVVVSRFNQFNYVGALVGAVLTGLVGAGSLRVGFAVPMLCVLALWPLARAFAPVAGGTQHGAART